MKPISQVLNENWSLYGIEIIPFSIYPSLLRWRLAGMERCPFQRSIHSGAQECHLPGPVWRGVLEGCCYVQRANLGLVLRVFFLRRISLSTRRISVRLAFDLHQIRVWSCQIAERHSRTNVSRCVRLVGLWDRFQKRKHELCNYNHVNSMSFSFKRSPPMKLCIFAVLKQRVIIWAGAPEVLFQEIPRSNVKNAR